MTNYRGRPLVIIIESDHGPGSGLDYASIQGSDTQERLGILTAIYFSDGDYRSLSGNLSAVNTFRHVFNKYFGSDLDILPHRSFFSTWKMPYAFVAVK